MDMIWQRVFNEAGLVAVLLMAACYVLWKRNDSLTTTLLDVMKQSIESNARTAAVLETIKEKLGA